MENYCKKNVGHLYISMDEMDSFLDFQKRFILGQSEEKSETAPEVSKEQLEKIETLTDQLVKKCADIFTGNKLAIKSSQVKEANQLIKGYVRVVLSHPDGIKAILNKISTESYYSYHAVSVASLAIFLSRMISGENQRMMDLLGFGGFVHDIGKSKKDDESWNQVSNAKITANERYRMHPVAGVGTLRKAGIVPEEVRLIVLQHHERADGKGFPSGVGGDMIFFPAKIVSVCDTLSHLISKKPYGHEMTVQEAMEIMLSRKGQFDSKMLGWVKKFARASL